MGEERQEVFERIPWETLERPRRDPNRMVMAVAGAVALGAIAYSFVRGQPVSPAPEPAVATTTQVGGTVPQTVGTVASPMVVAEADLYAVDEERLVDQVTAHAEWLAVEYFSYDGSEQSRLTLASLLPEGVPLPEAPEGTQVFVDWVGASSVTEIAPLIYEVGVTVRSLLSGPDTGFIRQAPARVRIEVMIGPDGVPVITRPPAVETMVAPTPHPLALDEPPAEVRAEAEAAYGPVVGGEQLPDGSWRVVAMVTGRDGVVRPHTITIP